ncbi:hypothetical protein [Aquidulcibacter sp.]|uniref:hypothetical protein n=1 Tax=Aquidulcibacter sp. TaxID=2052990 RepID=UPI0025BFA03B|nr:hypothetical protein [Aquidulcibacter sp.]MCA3064728.1 hypothetical protein [Rhodocyclaceae bacterium]MCA3694283.1 hypothetical protein [Aquidulcibacter sp.]
MNNASNLADLSQRREKNRINNEAAVAKIEGYQAGYDKAKQIYTGLVWALSLYGIVMTTAYFAR